MPERINKSAAIHMLESNPLKLAFLLNVNEVYACRENVEALKDLKATALVRNIAGDYEEFVDFSEVKSIIARNNRAYRAVC